MKKKLLSVVMVILLMASCCAAAFAEPADTTPEIQPRGTANILFVTDRETATRATVDVDVTFTQKVDQYSVVIYLQKLVNGSWQLDTTNEDYVYYNNGWNSYDFLFSKVYRNLERGSTYRIWCVSKDYIGSSSHIMNGYSSPF